MMLIARNVSLTVIRRSSKSPPSLTDNALTMLQSKINANNVSSRFHDKLEKFYGRILFNSLLEVQDVRIAKCEEILEKKRRRLRNYYERQERPLPLVLNQLCDGASSLMQRDEEDDDEDQKHQQELPYSKFIKVERPQEKELEDEQNRIPKNWLQEYELYDEADDELDSTYGTPDPTIPVSDVPCGGCGAQLHCKDPSIPGYVPSQLFSGLKPTELKTIHCQRCHFLVNYNTAINITVAPEDYINIISTIKEKYALAIILVDLMDFPCSVFTELSEILGKKRPVFIVGNKVDLIPRDHPNYLNHIKDCLRTEAMKMGFEEKSIRHISLISAKTGYGIEELITKLHSVWRYNGDVYLIGCTNVGKSSLFNALLKSDYCKVEAQSLVKRATACPWPGTTLRFLKFPILNPSDFRIHLRTQRLIKQAKLKHAEEALRREQAREHKSIKHATLIGHIGMTFDHDYGPEPNDPGSMSHQGGFTNDLFTLNDKCEKYKLSKWCYDTPGVIQRDQILHLLTTDEIIKTIPKEMIRVRAFLMRVNYSLFLAGLGRLDYVDGPPHTRVLVYSSLELPVSICETKDADEFYENFLGSEILGVPMDGAERLAKWPRLESTYEKIVVEGEEKHITVCDILLSSAGWIGINLPKDAKGTFRAWTPEKRGIHVRNPSILPYGMTLRGKRVKNSLAYHIGHAFTFKKNR